MPANLQSVDVEHERAELRCVLESKEFSRSPTLIRLLSYLCEKLFAGESDKIKEYSIAVEVFRRNESSFDQDSDSIVRVEANRLRKRLAEYYAQSGSTRPIRITIPVGQYVPRFEPAKGSDQDSSGHDRVSTTPAQPGGAAENPPPARKQRGKRWKWWLAAAILVAFGGGAGTWRLLRHQVPVAPVPSQAPAVEESDEQIGPPPGQEIRILAGTSRSLVDHAGKLWHADKWFAGGDAVRSPAQYIWRTEDPDFYQNSRQGQFRYDIPLKPGVYELRLHFAETASDPESTLAPESTEASGESDRIMTVRANGKTLLSDFDLATDAGAGRTADVKVFPDIRPGPDGILHLDFAGEDGKPATLSAIEVLPGVQGRMRPVRVLARQSPYYSNDSHWWSPDDYFEGGKLAAYGEPVKGTDDPELFETERWGNFSYAIPASPGKYSVTLYFAARRAVSGESSLNAAESKARTMRVFNVFCNGRVLLRNFDLSKEARQTDVVIRRFSGLEPNAQGKLLLTFVPVEGYAAVSGIEVLPQ
jgi:Malectin domain